MNKRRLLKLADLLEADAANKKGVKFDLGAWAAPATDDDGVWDKKLKQIEVSCGTAACAFGLAAISGAFKREGLTYGFRRQLYGTGYFLVPKFGRKSDFDAAAAFFDISSENAELLFDPTYYTITTGARAERRVAKRIRKLVETGAI